MPFRGTLSFSLIVEAGSRWRVLSMLFIERGFCPVFLNFHLRGRKQSADVHLPCRIVHVWPVRLPLARRLKHFVFSLQLWCLLPWRVDNIWQTEFSRMGLWAALWGSLRSCQLRSWDHNRVGARQLAHVALVCDAPACFGYEQLWADEPLVIGQCSALWDAGCAEATDCRWLCAARPLHFHLAPVYNGRPKRAMLELCFLSRTIVFFFLDSAPGLEKGAPRRESSDMYIT